MKYLDDLPHEMLRQTTYISVDDLVDEAKNHAEIWLETTTWETTPSGERYASRVCLAEKYWRWEKAPWLTSKATRADLS